MRDLKNEELASVSGGYSPTTVTHTRGPDGGYTGTTVTGTRGGGTSFTDVFGYQDLAYQLEQSGFTGGLNGGFVADLSELDGILRDTSDHFTEAAEETVDSSVCHIPSESGNSLNDLVAFTMVGVSTNTIADLGVSIITTSDGRSFITPTAGIGLGFAGVDAGAGVATSSDVFSGFGLTTGAFMQSTVSSSGAALFGGGQVGSNVGFGFEVTNIGPNPDEIAQALTQAVDAGVLAVNSIDDIVNFINETCNSIESSLDN